MPLKPELSPQPRKNSTALLVFARSVSTELLRRRWPRRFAPLLQPGNRYSLGMSGIDFHFFTDTGARVPGADPAISQFHLQTGRSFGERLRNALQTVAGDGYAHIIVVGGDCPALGASDVRFARDALQNSAAVIGPDHRGGTYLIGIHASDWPLLDEVIWQQNTDFEQLKTLFLGRRIAVLPTKIDLDRWRDLRLYACLEGAAVRWLARELARLSGLALRFDDSWVDLARRSEKARRKTSPPTRARSQFR